MVIPASSATAIPPNTIEDLFGIDTGKRLGRRRVEADPSGDVQRIAERHGIAERKTDGTIREIELAAALG
jgi:hypothetical protein